MMPLILRCLLIVFSILFICYVIKKVNSKKLQTQFSLVWLLIALILIIIAIFPQIVYFTAGLLGIEVSSNLVYLIGIICLMFIQLNLTVKVSKQSDDIKNLVQMFAINTFLEEEKHEKGH